MILKITITFVVLSIFASSAIAQSKATIARKTGCARILSAQDGFNAGNVYKLSDHSPNYPVFVTHNGARNGTAITSTGTKLDTFRYTGLANPDTRGRRHHYRFNRSCRTLPSNFLIKLGGICYRISSPCSRVD